MITFLTIWHYIVIISTLLIFLGGVYSTFTQTNKKLKVPMLISVTLVSLLLGVFSFLIVDKYTKEVKLYRLDSKRLLNIEKIVYTGIVKNEGDYEIGEVTFELKLINKGHATGNVKAGSFFSPSGFMDFFGEGAGVLFKPQTVKKEFVVAKNLKPGTAQSFRVYFDYPPYFRNVAEFSKVYGH